MPEDDTGNTSRPRPTRAPDPENLCTKPVPTPTPTPTLAPARVSQPHHHQQLDDDGYDHYGDDEQEDDHDEPEREREHSPTPLPTRRQPIQQLPPEQQKQQHQQPTSAPAPGPFVAHVHFHSRVRITSGLRHSHGTRSLDDSSDSDSPSSSISAPLRFRSRDPMPRMPLAERVSRLAAKTLQKRRAAAAAASSTGPQFRARNDGYAPLFGAARVPATYGAAQYGHSANDRVDADSDESRDEDDIAFGRWPWRALNGRVGDSRFLHSDSRLIVIPLSGGSCNSNQRCVAVVPMSRTLVND
jgi:hypothetical protein